MALVRKTTLQPSEVAAQIAEHYCKHDNHGYSQPNRYGNGTETITLTDGGRVIIQTGDIDCSWLAITCYKYQDIDTGNAFYTGNIASLLNTGNFVSIPIENRQRGDILNSTRAGHAAVYLGSGRLAEAHHGDYAGGLSGRTGDQDGTEVRITNYYNDQWTACYRCVVKRENSKPLPVGWIEENGLWWYRHEDGSYTVNDWEQIDGEWYNFDKSGWMRTGWYAEKGVDGEENWYYLYPEAVKDPDVSTGGHPKGSMARNTIIIDNGKSYKISDSGIMVKGSKTSAFADMSGVLHSK